MTAQPPGSTDGTPLPLQLATSHPDIFPLVARSLSPRTRKALRSTSRLFRSQCDASTQELDMRRQPPLYSLDGRFPFLKKLSLFITDEGDAPRLVTFVGSNSSLLASLFELVLVAGDARDFVSKVSAELTALLQSCHNLKRLSNHLERTDPEIICLGMDFALPAAQPWWQDFSPLLSCSLEEVPKVLASAPCRKHLVKYQGSFFADIEESIFMDCFAACCSLSQLTALVFDPFCFDPTLEDDVPAVPSPEAIQQMSCLTNLQHLELSNVDDGSMSAIAGVLHHLTALTRLDIADIGTPFCIPASWRSLSNLCRLSLADISSVSSLQQLSSFRRLEDLSLSQSIDADFSFIAHLTALTTLVIKYDSRCCFNHFLPIPPLPAHSLHTLRLTNAPAQVLMHIPSFTALHSLSLQDVPMAVAALLPVLLLPRITPHKLAQVHLQGSEVSFFHLHWLASLPSLKALKLVHTSLSPSFPMAAQPLFHFPSLRRLTISGDAPTAHLVSRMHMPTLQQLAVAGSNLHYSTLKPFLGITQLLNQEPERSHSGIRPKYTVTGLDDTSLLELARDHPAWLSSPILSIKAGALTEAGVIQAVTTAGPHLEHWQMQLQLCTDSVLDALASHCPNLKDLSILHASKLTDDALIRASHKCSSLTRLSLLGASKITQSGLMIASMHFARLRELRLHWYDVYGPALMSCFGQLPQLQVLEMHNGLRLLSCKGLAADCVTALLCCQPKRLLVFRVLGDFGAFGNQVLGLRRLQSRGVATGWECWRGSGLCRQDLIEVCRRGMANRNLSEGGSVARGRAAHCPV